MNVAQELGDDEPYDYDILVKLLGDRFDPASWVLASRSRFHGRSRRHHEDADSFADAIAELCRVGYPQSSPELRQELISEQFVRGQSDLELKKYIGCCWKLQTLIEVCTDFASLSPSVNIHRPAKQTFAVEEDEGYEEMFAMMDRSQWTGQGVSEPTIPPSLAQMFTLARRMGYEMRRLLADQTNRDLHVRCSPLDRDIVNTFDRDGTFPSSSASAVVKWDIRKLAAQSWIRRYHSNHRVGACSPMANNKEIIIHHRETPFRPGPHPNRSECNSSGHRFIFIDQPI